MRNILKEILEGFDVLRAMAERRHVRPKRTAWNNQRKARRVRIAKENSLYGPWYVNNLKLQEKII